MATSIAEADCVGFDIDHTLARYKNEALGSLIVRTFTTFLCETRGKPTVLSMSSLPLESTTYNGTIQVMHWWVSVCVSVRGAIV
jgi:hypothetical protein